MKRLPLVLFCFSLLFSSIRTENDKLCENLVKLNQYKSKVILDYHERELHIEEYRMGKKGKLIVSEKDKVEEVYYENFDTETSVVFYNKITNDCSHSYLRHENSEIVPPYRFFNSKSGILGPTGLWSLVEDDLKKLKRTEQETDERGIRTHVCEGFVRLREDAHTKVAIFLSELDWEIFDQRDISIPQLVRINIFSDRSFEPDESLPFKVEIKYLTFETIDESEDESMIFNLHDSETNENIWQVPSVCVGMNRLIPGIEISNQFKMRVHKLDELTGNIVFKMDVVYDEKNDLMSFTKIENDITTRKILKFEKQFFLVSSDNPGDYRTECTYHAYMNLELENSEVINFIQEFFMLHDSYFDYMGNRIVRNILTDVYVRNSTLHTDEQKGSYSIYIQQVKDQFNYVPVQVKQEKFLKTDHHWKLVESNIYSIYDFEPLENDEELVNAIKMGDCNQGKIEFNLAAINDFKEPTKLQDEIDLKAALRQSLVDMTGESLVNYPLVQVSIRPKEIISRIQFVDLDNPFNYFMTESKKNLLFGNRNHSNIILMDKKTIDDCAIESLKNDRSIGFQYCDFEVKYCHVLLPVLGHENLDKLTVIKRDDLCRTERKSVNENLKFNYETFNEKLGKLVKLARRNKFKLHHLDHDFVFNKIHFNKQESEIDFSNLYDLRKKGESISIQSTKRSFGIDDDVNKVADCYLACVNPKNNFTCDTFAFCNSNDIIECKLTSQIDDNDKHETTKMFEKESVCDTYTVSALRHFQEHNHRQLIDGNGKDKTIKTYDHKSSNHCSQMCLNHNAEIKNQTKRCSSIEVCEDLTTGSSICKLSTIHTLWDNQIRLKPNDSCYVYSVKHILNFRPTSQTLLKNFMIESVDSLDACATVCDISNDCHLFNYCDTESGKKCHYVRENQRGTEKIELESDLFGCSTYVHRSKQLGAVELDQSDFRKRSNKVESGFTIVELFKFMFTFLCLGMLIGGMIMASRWHKIKPRSPPLRTSATAFINADINAENYEEDSRL